MWTYRSYDAAGNRASVEIYSDVRTDYYYDDLDRMTHVFHNGATLLYSVYDPLGRRRSTMTDNGVFRQLTYTANNDVALVQQVAVGDQTNFLYGYNKVHQVTTTTVTNPAHAWVPAVATATSYTANALNQYTAVGPLSPSYDANGNLTGDGVTSYGYDVENRLVSVNRSGMTATYSYDVLGRRHSKTVNGVTTVYLHDGDREIAELDETGAILRRYVHAGGLDEVVAVIEADGTRRFLHRDPLGSVMAVTDAGGAVAERYAYGPFGESAVQSGTPWRFAGQRLDAESGLYYMRGRHYSPQLGRFVQPDPIGYEGGLNLYAYVNKDPLNLTDPMGTEPSGAKSPSLLEQVRPALEMMSLDATPLGVAASAALAVMDYSKGDIAGAGLNAMGALPLVGVAAGISKVEKSIELTAKQSQNLNRFIGKIPSNAKDNVVLHELPNGGVAAQATSPGKVPGSAAVYEKQIDTAGQTIQYTKTTYGPSGDIIHVKDKMI